MVQSGGCSANDFREVFKKNIERRVRSLPEIDGLSKETVLSSWIAKYDAIYRGEEDMRRQPQRVHLSVVSELILSKEQLYEMFQQILGIRKFEHQLLYNACQVGLTDSTEECKVLLVVDSLLEASEVYLGGCTNKVHHRLRPDFEVPFTLARGNRPPIKDIFCLADPGILTLPQRCLFLLKYRPAYTAGGVP